MKKLEKEAYGYVKDMFVQKNMAKRVVISALSILLMGFGISLFSVSGFGVDPFTSMNMNISAVLGIGFGNYQLIVNSIIILFVVIFAHRGWIGVGTLLNMVGVGYSCELFTKLINSLIGNAISAIGVRIALLGVGIIVLCFASSLFFVSNIGVGPYDAIGFMFSQETKISFKWIRVITDITVVMAGFIVSGGISAILSGNFAGIKNIGIGTIITAFMTGPLVNFFSKHVTSKILNVNYSKLGKNIAFNMLRGAVVKSNIPRY